MRVTEQTRARHFGATDLLMFTMALIWAINFSVVKYATQVFDPMVFVTLRVFASGVLLALVMLLKERPRLSRGTWIRLLLLGVAGHGLYQLCFVGGLARTRAGNAALIVAAAPAFIAITSGLRGLERVRKVTFAGIALSIAGVGLVVIGSSPAAAGGKSTMLGTILVFGGVLCWTVFTIGLQPFTRAVSATQIAGITILGGVVPLLLVTMPNLVRTNWGAVGAGGWLALFYSSVISMVVGYYLWYHGLKVLGATRTAVYTNLQPIIALGVAWIFLSEIPTAWQMIGAATIVSGIFLTRA